MKLNDVRLPKLRITVEDEPIEKTYGAEIISYEDKYARLPDILHFEYIGELEHAIDVLTDMLNKAKEYRETLGK